MLSLLRTFYSLSILLSTLAQQSTQSSSPPTSSPSPNQDLADSIDAIRSRRLDTFVGALPDAYIFANPADIDQWLSTLSAEGKWPDSEVDYTSGCPARRANWPAQLHWQRLLAMTVAWHGGASDINSKWVKYQTLRDAIYSGMEWWFKNDIGTVNLRCLDDGGSDLCPCGTAGLWNTNWFSNMILVPRLVGRTCLFLDKDLSKDHLSKCSNITLRTFDKLHTSTHPGHISGANALDIAAIGIDGALLTSNTSIITDAYSHLHDQMVIMNTIGADGVRADGSFAQHDGVIYNGNYGKDYARAVLDLETAAVGTEFAANQTGKDTLATLLNGDRWVIVKNVVTSVLHWDLSVIGRFISFPVADEQATGKINLNLTQIGQLGREWNSEALIQFSASLSKSSSNANAGGVIGNHMFYANDYMVHRGEKYVTTVKMYSKRTKNTECLNSQNPLGFHLSDGVVYTYQNGHEYEDIWAAWDWERIPGITVDRNGTALACGTAEYKGVESFAGGVSDGNIGAAAMRFKNPNTNAFAFQKAWFFLPGDVQVVLVANVTSKPSVSSVLDQKKHAGQVLVDGKTFTGGNTQGARTLWHDKVGYLFPQSNATNTLGVQIGTKSGDWSKIGTSAQPPVTVDLFSAWLEHTKPLSYIVFPGVDYDTFKQKSSTSSIQIAQNNGTVSAVYDPTQRLVFVVFWASGSVSVKLSDGTTLTITANGNAALIYNISSQRMTASDPSQSLQSLRVGVTRSSGTKNFVFTLPQGGLAGSSVTL